MVIVETTDDVKSFEEIYKKEDSIVIPPDVFWERKVDQYIQLWQYNKHDDEQFQNNLIRMGYEKGIVVELINKYNSEEEEE